MHHGHEYEHARRARRADGPFDPGTPPFGPGFGPAFRHGRARGGGFFPGGYGGPGGFGPARRPKGDIRAAILAELAAEDAPRLNGYGLMKAIGERTEGMWTPSPGSVYPTLQQLVDEGLIEASGAGRRTEFILTADGRAYAEEHAEELAAATRVPDVSDASRALMENAGRLMATLGQFRHSATDAQREAAAATLDETRKALYRILAE